MAVYNLGSVNIDHVYSVPHLPKPGETLAADAFATGLGGKGANQSVAAAKAGAKTFHIGAIGADGEWTRKALNDYGVDTTHLITGQTPTGHAIINVDPQGENAIVLYPGANQTLDRAQIARALGHARENDLLLMQNETSGQTAAAQLAAELGVKLLYSAAPFDIEALRAVLPFAHLLLMNEGEAAALRAALGALPDTNLIITKGAKGADWLTPNTDPVHTPAFRVTPVDTTGAGDCFAGTIAAALDARLPPQQAMRRASAAAAVQVTRQGAAKAMPGADEVDAFLAIQAKA